MLPADILCPFWLWSGLSVTKYRSHEVETFCRLLECSIPFRKVITCFKIPHTLGDNHSQSLKTLFKIFPKLPKLRYMLTYSLNLPQINQIAETSKIYQKLRFYFFFKFCFLSMQKRYQGMISPFGPQSNKFSHAFSIVKDRPLYLSFSIPPCENSSFSLSFIGPMRVEIMQTCTQLTQEQEFEETHFKK